MIKQYKVNSQITVPQVRLIAEDGKQVGIFSRDEALDYALAAGADLVLIGESAKPPVAKVIDFKKFLYQEQKKAAEARKGQKNTGIKEIRVGSPFAASADVGARIKKASEYLKNGRSVKIVIKFSGRQITHPEFGHRIVDQFKQQLTGVGKIDRDSRFEGKQLITVFSPAK